MPPTKTQDKTRDNGAAEVAVIETRYDTDDLAAIQSFDDAVRLATEVLGQDALATADAVLGDGFAVIEDKAQLVKTPFIILSWTETLGDHGPFTVARAVTRDNRKVVIVDGSTGIHAQLSDYTRKTGRTGGLLVKHGLRVSEYEYEDASGETKPAKTYYLDTSA